MSEDEDLETEIDCKKPAAKVTLAQPSAKKENKRDVSEVAETISVIKKFNDHLEKHVLMAPDSRLTFEAQFCEGRHFMKRNSSAAYAVIQEIRSRLPACEVEVKTLKDKYHEQIVVVRVVAIDEAGEEATVEDETGMETLVVDEGFLWLGLITAIRVRWEYGKYHYRETVSRHQPSPKTTKVTAIPTGTEQTKITLVSGPYFSPTELDFLGIHMVRAMVAENRSNILVMMGPFVDYNHPDVREGRCVKSYPDMLNEMVAHISNGLSGVQLYVVPSIHDATHGYPLPQPRMQLASKDVVAVGNPAYLRSRDGRLALQVINYDFIESIRSNSVGSVKSELIERIYDEYLRQDMVMSYATAPIAECELESLYLKDRPHGSVVVYSSRVKQANIVQRGSTVFLNVGSLMGNASRVGNLVNLTYFAVEGAEVCDCVYGEIKRLVY